MKEKDFDQRMKDILQSHDSELPQDLWSKIKSDVKAHGDSDQQFDDLIESKLSTHESPISDRVWTAIQNQLKRRKPRLVIPYLLLSLGLLISIGLVWSTFNEGSIAEPSKNTNDGIELNSDSDFDSSKGKDELNKVDPKQKVTSQHTIEQGQLQSAEASATIENKGSNEKSNQERESSVNLKEESNAAAADADKGNSSNAINSPIRSTQSSQLAISQNNNVSSSISTANDQHQITEFDASAPRIDKELNNSVVDEEDKLNSIGGTMTPSSNEINIEQSNVIINDGNSLDVKGELVSAIHENETSLTNQSQIDKAGSELLSDEKDGQVLAAFKDSKRQSQFVSKLVENKSKNSTKKIVPLGNGRAKDGGLFIYDPCSVKGGKKKNRVHCFSFVKKSQITFADFTVGPQYSNKLLKNRLANEASNLLRDREDTESYMFSYNVQARLGIKTNSGLTGTVGLSYDRYNERFQFFDPNERRIITRIGSNGDTLEVRVEAIGERTVKHTNSLTFISIPFTAGYMWQADKFNVGIQGGLSLNLLFTKGGRIVDTDGGVITLNGDAKKDIYKNSAGFSAIGGLVFEYKLRDNLSFIVEPSIKYNLSSLTKDRYSIDQKYVTTGLNIGFRSIINKKITQKKKYGVN